MIVTFIYFLLFLFLITFFLTTKNYKSECFNSVDKKKDFLKPFYGTALFIHEKLNHFKHHFFPNLSSCDSKLKNNMDKLHAGKNIDIQMTLFYAKRISYSFLFITAFVLFGLIYSVSCQLNSSSTITSLDRSSEDTDYSLEVTFENKETQVVDISVAAKEYDFKETFELFESYREEIVTSLLNGNPNIETISTPLNFISGIGEEGLSIDWEIDNEMLIDYSGEIFPENIDSEGASTTVTANLKLGEYSASLNIPLVLVP